MYIRKEIAIWLYSLGYKSDVNIFYVNDTEVSDDDTIIDKVGAIKYSECITFLMEHYYFAINGLVHEQELYWQGTLLKIDYIFDNRYFMIDEQTSRYKDGFDTMKELVEIIFKKK